VRCLKLYFPEITFSAAHYIPGHEKCGGVHGHTYFVRDLEIEFVSINEQGMFIDFGDIKGYFKEQWDHKFIVPLKDEEFWLHNYRNVGYCPVDNNLKAVARTTAEGMAMQIQEELAHLIAEKTREKTAPHFKLFEGPNQSVEI